MLPMTLKGFTAFVDGVGYLGKLTGGSPCKLALKVEEYRDGGMDGSIELDTGTDKMETSLSFAEYDRAIYKLFGRMNGDVALTLRGSQETEEGVTEAIEYAVRGTVKELDAGEWKGDSPSKSELKLMHTARYVRIEIGGEEVVEIDPVNVVRRIGGVDQLAARRANLGL